MTKTMRFPLYVLTAGLLVGGCSGVGDGNTINSTHIVESTTPDSEIDEPVTEGKAYQCIPAQLRLIGKFDDDSLGEYTSRAVWTSSNPAVAKISNGDEPVPGDEDPALFYQIGTIVPVAPGQTTISASFLGLQAQIAVSVLAPTELSFDPVDPRIAPKSVQALRVHAKLDGVLTDITSATEVALPEDSEEIATLSRASTTSGEVDLITGVAASGSALPVTATFPLCTTTVETSLRVADITALTLTHEEGFAGELVAKTTEALKVMADFGDGPEQDLTSQTDFTVTDADEANVLASVSSGFLVGSLAGPVTVKAVFGAEDAVEDDPATEEDETQPADPGIPANDLPVTIVAGTLNSFTVTPATAEIAPLKSQQFVATGSFDNGTRTQKITRHVGWSITNNDEEAEKSLGAVGNGVSANAGLVVSTLDEAGSATIKAVVSGSEGALGASVPEAEREKTATLTITPGYVPPEEPAP